MDSLELYSSKKHKLIAGGDYPAGLRMKRFFQNQMRLDDRGDEAWFVEARACKENNSAYSHDVLECLLERPSFCGSLSSDVHDSFFKSIPPMMASYAHGPLFRNWQEDGVDPYFAFFAVQCQFDPSPDLGSPLMTPRKEALRATLKEATSSLAMGFVPLFCRMAPFFVDDFAEVLAEVWDLKTLPALRDASIDQKGRPFCFAFSEWFAHEESGRKIAPSLSRRFISASRDFFTALAEEDPSEAKSLFAQVEEAASPKGAFLSEIRKGFRTGGACNMNF